MFFNHNKTRICNGSKSELTLPSEKIEEEISSSRSRTYGCGLD